LPIYNLKVWRDKKLAHIEKDFIKKSINLMKSYPVKITEIDDIISTLHEILDKYRVSYDGVGWVLGLPSTKNQMKYIMDSLSYYRKHKYPSLGIR
jgi:hypothetical protein